MFMKKLAALIFMLVSISGHSEITLDFQKPLNLYPVRLNNTEVKYVDKAEVEYSSQTQFTLYNLDGTQYKIIQLPLKPSANAFINRIAWISTTLFDNDPSNIEFMLSYQWDSLSVGTNYKVVIGREDGTILLDEMNAMPNYWDPLVYGTAQGTKLLLYYEFASIPFPYQTKVFSLPGEIPTSIALSDNHVHDFISLYPNPNNGSFLIKVNASSEKTVSFDLYSGNGKLIDTFRSADKLISVTKPALPDGLYLLKSRSEHINSTDKVIIKK